MGAGSRNCIQCGEPLDAKTVQRSKLGLHQRCTRAYTLSKKEKITRGEKVTTPPRKNNAFESGTATNTAGLEVDIEKAYTAVSDKDVDPAPWDFPAVIGSVETIAIPDLHAPWGSEKQLQFAIQLIERTRPKFIVQLGDGYDMFSFSRYARSFNLITPKQELKQGRAQMERLWAAVRRASPESKCYQILGNHDIRVTKQILSKFPEAEAVLEEMDWLKRWRFDGVELQPDSREPLELNGILYHHGDFLKTAVPGARVKYLLKNVVFGHTHLGGTYYLPRGRTPLWELACGHIAYSDALPLQYMPLKMSSTVEGFGMIDAAGPRFVATPR